MTRNVTLNEAGRTLSALAVLLAASSPTTTFEDNMTNATATKAPLQYVVPYEGTGQLATIWSSGSIGPHGDALIITSHGESKRVDVEAPNRVRWRLPTELIVQQDILSSATHGDRILRIDRTGHVLAVLGDGEHLVEPQPAPGGRWLALQRLKEGGVKDLEVRDFDNDLRPLTIYPRGPELRTLFPAIVWSPDAAHLVTTTMVQDPQVKGALFPRLVLLDRDNSDSIRRVPDGPNGKDAEHAGVAPLFWNERGLYVRSNRGLLRCDPNGSGCEFVYGPGEARFAFTGTAVGNDQALLLVQDHKTDPLETRATEIHQVDLATGKGRVLLRLADGVFIDDIDWIADPAT
jgi:hypothetical protein